MIDARGFGTEAAGGRDFLSLLNVVCGALIEGTCVVGGSEAACPLERCAVMCVSGKDGAI